MRLIDLIKAYGLIEREEGGSTRDDPSPRAREALAAVQARIQTIRDAISWNDTDKDGVYVALDGTDE